MGRTGSSAVITVAAEELQDPGPLHKGELFFPSGEALPRCWIDPHYSI